MATNPELEAQIIAEPSSVPARLVYADWLQSQEDPRGEWIMLQHRGDAAEAEAFRKAHEADLLGPLMPYRTTFDGFAQPAFEYHLGFIRHARLSYDSNSASEVDIPDGVEISLPKGLELLLTHPLGRALESLTLPINMLDDGCYFEPILQVLAQHGSTTLRRLRIGEYEVAGPGGISNGYDYEISWSMIGDARGLFEKLPRLEHLRIQAGLGGTSCWTQKDQLGAVNLPALRDLEVVTGGMDQGCLRSLATAAWPTLEKMDLWLGSSDYGFTGSIEDLMPVLDGGALPRLRRLGIMNTELTDELCTLLPKAKVLPQLSELSLAYGTLTDSGLQALTAHADRFAHLSKLDLSENLLSEAGITAAAQLGDQVVALDQRGDEFDEDERYVALGE